MAFNFCNEVLENIWKDRYQKNGESLDENFKRVARYCSTNEDEYREFYDVLSHVLFLPAGRTMSNSGIGRDLTLNNCFLAGTKVITNLGLKNIEDVRVGEYVISADDQWHRVVNTLKRNYSGDIYKISGTSLYDDIYCTPNHQFLTQNGWVRADRLLVGKRVTSQDRLKVAKFNFPKSYLTVDLKNVLQNTDTQRIVENENSQIYLEKFCSRNRHNDNINWMRVNNPINRYIDLTPGVRYLIGRWIGDGSITRYKGKKNPSIVQIVFNAEKERDQALRCKNIGDNAFGIVSEWRETSQNTIAVRWANEILATWFLQEFGEKCDGKRLSEKYIGDLEIAKGLFDSDGCINTHGSGKLVLKNHQLIQWFRDTMFLNGFNTRIIKKDRFHNDTYEVSYDCGVGASGFNFSLTKTYHDARENKVTNNDLYTKYTPIESIDILENQNCQVYNLSVDGEHSYTANGVVVHNCFVAPQVKDDLGDIFSKVSLGARTHQRGGGIGYDFSQIRPKDSPTSNDAIASGPVSFMDVFNAQTATILQGGRRGANMGVLSVYHMDIEDFIHAKSYDAGKLVHFNISVMVDDDFITAVREGKKVWLHHPVYNGEGKIEKNPDNWIYKKEVDARTLWNEIIQKAYDNGEPGIFFYDNLNKDNNLWYIENIVCSNPCAEYLSGTVYGNNPITGEPLDSSQFGGACNLGSLFLHNFVVNPFKKDAHLDYEKLKQTIFTGVKMLDNIIDINHFPDPIYENYQKKFRTIGFGFTGLADTLVMLNLDYRSNEARQFVFELTEFMTRHIYKASIELSKLKGSFAFLDREKFIQSGFIQKHAAAYPEWEQIQKDILTYGIRNAKMISVAPTGTLSLTFGNNCSSGLEPIFSLEYERKVKMGGQSDDNIKIVKMRDYAYGEWLKIKDDPDTIVTKDKFITALEMTVDEHVEMLRHIAWNVDMSCSKTINVPTEYSFEDTKTLYLNCHDKGIKGCTIFRPNPIRQGIMITDSSKDDDTNNNEKITTSELIPRGVIIKADDNCIGMKRTLQTGCGTLHCEAFFDPATGDLLETYLSKGSTGGCNNFMIGLSRMISLSARGGVDIYSIIDQLKSCGVCPSYAVRTATKHDTSKGSCCPMAAGNALLDMYQEIQNNLNEDVFVVNTTKDNDTQANSKPINKEVSIMACPQCGEPLSIENGNFQGGCISCHSCGWSKCE